MVSDANTARPRAVIRCSGSGQPVALRKVAFSMPIAAASSVISSAKASSVPAIASASAMAASLPDCTMMPRRMSCTVTREPISTNIFEPPLRQAFSEIGISSSIFSRPSASRSKAMNTVMILVMDAGGIGSSAFFWNSTWPVS